MKTPKKIILIFFLILSSVPFFEQTLFAEEHVHQAVQAKYRCPMHHQIISDKPGKCPICGMELVLFTPGTAAAEGEHTSIAISTEKQRLVGIKTAVVEKRPLQKRIRALGSVAHEEMLYEAQLDYLKALRDAPNAIKEKYLGVYQKLYAPTTVESAKLKLMQLGMDEESIAQMNRTTPPDKALLHISEHGEDWISFSLYEYEAPLVKKGDKVHVEIPGMAGVELEGEVKMVSPFVDMGSRTIKGRALVLDEKHFLKPEMFVTVFVEARLEDAVAVPLDAVLLTGGRSLVFVEEKEGVFKPRSVVVGAQAGEFWEIKQGLMEGEKVAVSGNFLLDSESRLNASSDAS